jgi:hypothetical protein
MFKVLAISEPQLILLAGFSDEKPAASGDVVP